MKCSFSDKYCASSESPRRYSPSAHRSNSPKRFRTFATPVHQLCHIPGSRQRVQSRRSTNRVLLVSRQILSGGFILYHGYARGGKCFFKPGPFSCSLKYILATSPRDLPARAQPSSGKRRIFHSRRRIELSHQHPAPRFCRICR